MILKNISVFPDKIPLDIHVEGSTIEAIGHFSNSNDDINLEGTVALPGLINSHDHLDFNLFNQMGNQIYSNYMEWGPYIQKTYATEIDAILKIPKSLRIKWGVYKNLLAGVTTVADHSHNIPNETYPIDIIRNIQNLHSVQFEPGWKYKLNNPLAFNKYCVIHIGEGTDINVYNEIQQLIRYNFIKRKIIGIHGIAMNEKQAKLFKAIVWCPVSNDYMFHQTANIERLKHYTQILFGTDSTLTSHWNIWNHLRVAKEKNSLTGKELFDSITEKAASIWKINTGVIKKGKYADIIILQNNIATDYNSVYSTNPEDLLLVISKGVIKIADETVINKIPSHCWNKQDLGRIEIKGRIKYVPKQMIETMKAINNIKQTQFPCSNVKNAIAG
jgi:cytosine/adenosine deaminase-related metal-dependent hydrolase